VAQKVLDALVEHFGDAILSTRTERGGDDVAVVDREHLLELANFLRDDPAMAFDTPSYCTAIDWLGRGKEPRFEAVYGLRSNRHNHRIRIKVPLADGDATCPSLTPLWRGLNWPEREVYDMYGIVFEGHPDLRRILMYDEFVGHPLRKDYPKEKRQPLVRRDRSDL
jgi:NADH-quinone oxidoreductase subunit C